MNKGNIKRTAALRQRKVELNQALDKARQLNELQRRFLSMASHEFKTPLSTVLSSAELIGLYAGANQQPQRERHLERIKDAVGQLTEMLTDFLSLTQLEEGEIKPELREVNLHPLLLTSIETSEGQLRSGQHVELEVDGTTIQLVTDPKLLRHVLTNLLSNAAKYSSPGSPILLRSRIAGDRVQISVTDHGIGIPEEDQPHLFARFYRAQNVENIQGTGLGLNIVAHYVKLLGGIVTFTSKSNVGTTFIIDLPHHN